uniref:BED-type domain-containing protein n=1 Tax=Panagrolaimus sp. JU765 TaxID=591449 RepID=A0AC34RII1_9BILA
MDNFVDFELAEDNDLSQQSSLGLISPPVTPAPVTPSSGVRKKPIQKKTQVVNSFTRSSGVDRFDKKKHRNEKYKLYIYKQDAPFMLKVYDEETNEHIAFFCMECEQAYSPSSGGSLNDHIKNHLKRMANPFKFSNFMIKQNALAVADISNILTEHNRLAVEFLKTQLANSAISGYAVTVDETPLIQKYYGVKVQFIEEGQLKNVALSVQPIEDTTANGIWIATKKVLDFYGLDQNKIYFLSDEGSNMVSGLPNDILLICQLQLLNTTLKHSYDLYKISRKRGVEINIPDDVKNVVNLFAEKAKKLKGVITTIKQQKQFCKENKLVLKQDCDTRFLYKIFMFQSWVKIPEYLETTILQHFDKSSKFNDIKEY